MTLKCACASVASLLLINSRRHTVTYEVYRKLRRNRRTDAFLLCSLTSLSFHTGSNNSNNKRRPLVPLLKVISQLRYRGSLTSTMGPSGGHHRGHQKCPRQHRCPVAKLLISLETGVCLGPSVGTIGLPGAPPTHITHCNTSLI